MCGPAAIAIAGTAVSVAGKVVEHRARSKQASSARGLADQNLALERRDLAIRATEEKRATARSIDEILLDAGIVTGSVQQSAATGNVRGQSVNEMLRDVERSAAGEIDTLRDQETLTLAQLQRLREGSELRREAAHLQNKSPSKLATGLRIGADLIGGVTTHDQLKAIRS